MFSSNKGPDYRASWGFNEKLENLSSENFGRGGTKSHNSGFILDHRVMTKKFSEYAGVMASITSDLSGEIEYFEPEEKDQGLTEPANKMDKTLDLVERFNGTQDKRDRLAEEIIEAIEEKHGRKEISSVNDLVEVLEGKSVLGADLTFKHKGKAANLKFDSSNIRSYQKDNSETDREKPFQVRLYGDEDFRKKITRRSPDLAGNWNDWDLARNKLKRTCLGKKILNH